MARTFFFNALAVAWGLFFLPAVSTGQAAGPGNLLSLIPGKGDLLECRPEGEPAVCLDEDCLSGFIDGAAPYYLQRGTLAVLFQGYLCPSTGGELRLQLYLLRDAESARDLWREVSGGGRSGPGTDHAGLGEERSLEQVLPGIWILHFWRGPYLVRIEGSAGQEGRQEGNSVLSAAITLGSWIDRSLLSSGSKPR